ncbi:MAG: S41 family peptidase, partial [Cyclobacteriaceae bacterium]
MNKQFVSLIFLLFFLSFIWSCKDDEEQPEPELSTNEKIYEFIKYWYLWNSELPDNVNPNAYNSPEALMDAIIFKPIDKWSFITSWESFDLFFRQGSFTGFGMGLKLDAQNQLRITYAYDDSPAGQAGFDRGDKINKLNGESVDVLLQEDRLNNVLEVNQTILIEGVKLNGDSFNQTLSKAAVGINTVLYHDVIVDGDYRIGYFVFNNFIEKSYADLKIVFDEFKAQGVNEIVIDLRYNGGGTLGATDSLASLLRKTTTENELFLEIAYNEDRTESNEPIYFKKLDNAAEITRLYAITTSSS